MGPNSILRAIRNVLTAIKIPLKNQKVNAQSHQILNTQNKTSHTKFTILILMERTIKTTHRTKTDLKLNILTKTSQMTHPGRVKTNLMDQITEKR